MPIPHRRLLVLAAAGLAASPAAFAQPAWPDRPVRVVVPYPPGGSNDILARVLAETLRERLPQPWIVENRAGANGNVGADAVAKAPPDGHALLLTAPGPLAINDRLYRALPYDPARDLVPIALVATVPIVLMATNALPVRTVPELVALARREPGRLAFGSFGNGSTNHLAGELLKPLAGIEMVHVPYRGAAPAMTDLVAGQVQVMFDNMPCALPQIREGRVRALAVAGARRAAVLPELPTVAEAAGLPDFAAEAWFGLAAPGGTPPAVVARIGAAVLEALAEPGLRARFAAAGAEPGALDPAGFAAFVAAERRKWARVVEASGARAE